MKHSIHHRKPIFRSGQDVVVHLEFSEDEKKLIKQHNMHLVPIVERPISYTWEKDSDGRKRRIEVDNNIYFRDFYKRRTSWRADSNAEAQDFHAKVFQGLQRFHTYLQINSKTAVATEGDFAPPEPPPFVLDMIPDYMWKQHIYILAESGGGKTQLLQTLFKLHQEQKNPPGFVIIDSQNKMLPLIAKKVPDSVMISPTENPPSFDLFNPSSLTDSSNIAERIDTFQYLFEAGGQPLTDRQRTPFTYAIALMLFGYPLAHGHPATIDDLEDYLTGRKKGRELSPNAHRAVASMDAGVQGWYYNQYPEFASSHSEILQRLNNICGTFSPLRPLFSKRTKTLNLRDMLESRKIVLVNTDHARLGRYGSSFFGRCFFKLLDQAVANRDELSPPVIFMTDEVQEYFDAKVITPFTDQARKRNISCVFAHQRLGQLPKDGELRDALTGVGTLICTNANRNDVRNVASWFNVEDDEVRTWRPEFRENGELPRYSDYGLYLRGKLSADTFRLPFLLLERTHERRGRQSEQEYRQTRTEPPKPPPKEGSFDDRYDMEWKTRIRPDRAKRGFVLVVKCPNGHEEPINVPPGAKSGMRFCLKGKSQVRRPDGTMGNYWVEIEVPEMDAERASSSDPPPQEPPVEEPPRTKGKRW